MYNTYNKSEIFYLYDIYNDVYWLIGNKEELIYHISKSIETHRCKDSSRWTLDTSNINITSKDVYRSLDGWYCDYSESKYYLRRYSYFDGNMRHINPMDYKEEAMRFIKESKTLPHQTSYRRLYRSYKKYHSGNKFKNKMPQCYRTKRQNADPEVKEFVRRRDKEFPDWWDDTSRRVSCCWKDQTKDTNQWSHKNKSKNRSSIKYITEDEFFDIDALLEEDFENN